MHKRQIVICDCDAHALQDLSRALYQLSSAEVIQLQSGNEVLNYVRSTTSSPDLLILEQLLPDMKATELIPLLRIKDKLRELPIILMSGETAHIAYAATKAGASDFLRKPIEMKELGEKIAAFLFEKGNKQVSR
jgi:DNA-binding response OmpR family regulator